MMEAMKTVMEAFHAQFEGLMKTKRDKMREMKAHRQRILNDCIKSANRVKDEKVTHYMARMTKYMEDFETKEKPKLVDSTIGKLKVQIDSRVLAKLVMQYTSIYEQQEEGKEQVELAKDSMVHLTD